MFNLLQFLQIIIQISIPHRRPQHVHRPASGRGATCGRAGTRRHSCQASLPSNRSNKIKIITDSASLSPFSLTRTGGRPLAGDHGQGSGGPRLGSTHRWPTDLAGLRQWRRWRGGTSLFSWTSTTNFRNPIILRTALTPSRAIFDADLVAGVVLYGFLKHFKKIKENLGFC